MKPENAIEVKDITKKFKVYMDKGYTLKEKALFRKRRAYDERNVLNGISFEVKKGEAVGLIGHNGCGKSTTLKLLTKIMYPDSGTIDLCGRVSSLIELGAGFHPDLSGRENIYINASIFGLTRQEIDQRIGEIIAFSELEEFIDHPVRTYSSGMYMRLAFSVAIHVDADILLIDEILAVGDAGFQAKCFNRLREIKAGGATIVIVSHSLGQIEEICERTIWIDEGKIRREGRAREVCYAYTEFMSRHTLNSSQLKQQEDMPQHKAKEEKAVIIKSIKIKDLNGAEKKCFRMGESADVEIELEPMNQDKEKVSVELAIVRNDGLECFETDSFREGIEMIDLQVKGMFRCKISELNLVKGEYWIEAAIRRRDSLIYEYKEKACSFSVTSLEERGIVRLDHKWIFEKERMDR